MSNIWSVHLCRGDLVLIQSRCSTPGPRSDFLKKDDTDIFILTHTVITFKPDRLNLSPQKSETNVVDLVTSSYLVYKTTVYLLVRWFWTLRWLMTVWGDLYTGNLSHTRHSDDSPHPDDTKILYYRRLYTESRSHSIYVTLWLLWWTLRTDCITILFDPTDLLAHSSWD